MRVATISGYGKEPLTCPKQEDASLKEWDCQAQSVQLEMPFPAMPSSLQARTSHSWVCGNLLTRLEWCPLFS